MGADSYDSTTWACRRGRVKELVPFNMYKSACYVLNDDCKGGNGGGSEEGCNNTIRNTERAVVRSQYSPCPSY